LKEVQETASSGSGEWAVPPSALASWPEHEAVDFLHEHSGQQISGEAPHRARRILLAVLIGHLGELRKARVLAHAEFRVRYGTRAGQQQAARREGLPSRVRA